VSTTVAHLVARVTSDLSGFNKGMATMQGTLGRVSSGMTSTGMAATKFLTLPIVGVGAASVMMAMDFNRSMTQIAALVGASTGQMKQYESAIFHMSQTGKGSAQDLAEALYFITSSGFKGAAAIKVLDASATAAAAGLGNVQSVADLVTSAINVYGAKNLTAARAVDILTASVREGKAEPEEFASSLGRVLPVAEQLGVSFAETSGSLAALTLGGLDAAEGTTALRGAMMAAFDPTKKAKAALADIGMTSQDLRDKIRNDGLLPAILHLNKAFGGSSEQMGAIFGNVRGLVGALNLAGNRADENAKLIDRVKDSVGDTGEAFKKAGLSPAKQFTDAMNAIKTSMIQAGSIILPFVAQFMNWIARLALAFDGLSPQGQKLVILGAIIAAAIGPVLIILGLLVGAIAAIATPVGLVVVGIALLVGAFAAALASSQTFRDALGQIGPALQGIITWATQMWTQLVGLWNQHSAEIKATMRAMISHLQGLWATFGGPIIAVVTALFNMMKGIVTTAMNVIKNVILAIMAVIRGDWQQAWDYLKAAAGAAITGAKNLIVAVLTQLAPAVLSLALAIGKNIWNGIKAGLSLLAQLAGHLLGKLGSAIASAASAVPGLAADIGRKIVSGILSGLGGLVGQLKSKLEGMLKGALSSLNPFSPVEHGGEKYIGRPIAEGALKGIIMGWTPIPPKLKEKVREAIEAARQAVQEGQSALSSAFSNLASASMSAFDKKMGGWKSEAERALEAMDLQDKVQGIADGIANAQKAIAEAVAKGDADALASANKQMESALRAQTRFQLEQQAAIEREGGNAIIEAERVNFEKKLAAIQSNLAKGKIPHDEAQKQIMALYAKYGIDYQNAGRTLGAAIAAGLRDSMDEVERAAFALARVIAKHLKTKSPTEAGPMSDLNNWWGGFADTLLEGLDTKQIQGALNFAPPVGSVAAAGGGGGPTIHVEVNAQNLVSTKRELVDEVAGVIRAELRRTPDYLSPR
jgi:TP901 family phage tail tape measure protein